MSIIHEVEMAGKAGDVGFFFFFCFFGWGLKWVILFCLPLCRTRE